MDVERLGRVIELTRTARGLGLAQLASKSGLSSGYLSLLERGLRKASPEALVAISEAVGMPVQMLEAFAERKARASSLGAWFQETLP